MERRKETAIKKNFFSFFYKRVGKRSGQQKFYSPKKQKHMPKGCVMLRRELFRPGILESIANGRLNICKKVMDTSTRMDKWHSREPKNSEKQQRENEKCNENEIGKKENK